jgi:hypothetical protein
MEEFEKLVAESFQSEMLPLSEDAEAKETSSADTVAAQIESEPEVADSQSELASAESHAAGENDPAA